jgi:hypothetical protein
MQRIELYDDVVHPFLMQLGSCPRYSVLATAHNGFEGWLKWELLEHCTRRLLRTDAVHRDALGVECREPLRAGGNGQPTSKLVDFWIASELGTDGPAGYHFLELKVIFANGNWTKMARSAGRDIFLLSRLPTQSRAKTRGVLAFVIGADEAFVTRVANTIRDTAPRAARPVTNLPPLHNSAALYFEQSER